MINFNEAEDLLKDEELLGARDEEIEKGTLCAHLSCFPYFVQCLRLMQPFLNIRCILGIKVGA